MANFLLAWHNAGRNCGWDPVDLWNVDAAIADDILTVLRLVRDSRRYPGDLGFEPEISEFWERWSQGRETKQPDAGAPE